MNRRNCVFFEFDVIPVLKVNFLQVDRHPEVLDHLNHPALPTGIPPQPDCGCLASGLVKEPCKSQPNLVLGQN